ncbi:MAG: 1-(5-phosphoribosyl)-5-[(5-phosphoribosylamino)methylideneamino]imidazole-4-carboxamide isomerase [Candidatus Omnitrophota bacterium]
MQILPAIDIRDGKVVRLLQGDYARETVYHQDPLEVAKIWVQAGAEIIHIVDLDGARTGILKNLAIVKNIVKKLKVKVHLGGGVRSIENIKTILNADIHRVIVGTKVFTDPDFLVNITTDPVLRENLDRIIIGLDCRKIKENYFLAHSGWTQETKLDIFDYLKKIEKVNIAMVLVTDISRDGMLKGPNIEFLKLILNATKINIIASGGITSLEDIKQLINLNTASRGKIYGIIIGKALYENKLTLREAINCES